MKEKIMNRLKWGNRGLMLAVIIIVAIAIKIIIADQNFKNEKADIEKTVTDYISEWNNALATKNYSDDSAWTEEEGDSFIAGMDEVLKKYWAPGGVTGMTNANIVVDDNTTQLANVKKCLNVYKERNAAVISANCTINKTKVTRCGENGALVKLELDTNYKFFNTGATAEAVPADFFIYNLEELLNGADMSDGEYEEYTDKDGNVIATKHEVATEKKPTKIESIKALEADNGELGTEESAITGVAMSVYLERINGEWKIKSIVDMN